MDRGAWWVVVHSVSKSPTRMKQLSMHVCKPPASQFCGPEEQASLRALLVVDVGHKFSLAPSLGYIVLLLRPQGS